MSQKVYNDKFLFTTVMVSQKQCCDSAKLLFRRYWRRYTGWCKKRNI